MSDNAAELDVEAWDKLCSEHPGTYELEYADVLDRAIESVWQPPSPEYVSALSDGTHDVHFDPDEPDPTHTEWLQALVAKANAFPQLLKLYKEEAGIGEPAPDATIEYDIKVAVVRPSHFRPGLWNALALWPESRCIASNDTRDEAATHAEAFRDRVMEHLRRARSLGSWRT